MPLNITASVRHCDLMRRFLESDVCAADLVLFGSCNWLDYQKQQQDTQDYYILLHDGCCAMERRY